MGYCFFSTEKIKSFSAMAAKWKHNTRQYQPANADPTLSYLNKELIKTDQSYNDIWREKINELKNRGTLKRKIRKDAVLGIEVVLTLARKDAYNVDIEKWQEENIKWLNKEFNEKGTDNVVSASYHADECGSVHIHAFVVPITEQGRLSAKHYTDGPGRMAYLQTSYAKAMEQFGLERGLKKSVAKHEDIKKFYTELNSTIYAKNPSPEKEESIEEFSTRVNKFIEDLRVQHLQEKKKMERQIVEAKTYSKNDWIELMKEKEEYEKKLKKIKKLLKEKEDYAIEHNLSDKEVTKRLNTISYLQNGIRNMDDRDYAEKLSKEINKVIKEERSREKELELGYSREQ